MQKFHINLCPCAHWRRVIICVVIAGNTMKTDQHIQLENTKIQNIPLSLPFPEYYLTCFYCFCSLWKKNPSVHAIYNNNYYSFIPYKRTSLALHLIPFNHIQLHKTDLYKRSVVIMGTKLYNKLPSYIKGIDRYKTFKRGLKSLLLMHSIYSVEEFLTLWFCNFISSISNLSCITLDIRVSETMCRILCSLLLNTLYCI